ncbi:MAG TPA: hypothetical protein VK191_02310 [Symbiobacteriaceae bacterium]|nr:hypothetical protein [Symbiobacteriaceae bacterium]
MTGIGAPAAGALRYPQSPVELLQAFIFAQAYGLREEANSYLAKPEMASQFPLAEQPEPSYTEPEVGVGQVVQAGQVNGASEPKKGEAPATGPIPFFAVYYEYEGYTVQHGTAQIGRAPDGRLVIASIEFAKNCYSGI